MREQDPASSSHSSEPAEMPAALGTYTDIEHQEGGGRSLLRRPLETSPQLSLGTKKLFTQLDSSFPQTCRLEKVVHVPQQLQPCPTEQAPGACGLLHTKPASPGEPSTGVLCCSINRDFITRKDEEEIKEPPS